MKVIQKDQIYFADKDRHSGVFELFNLADFPVRTNDNIRKAYLQKHYPAYMKRDSATTAETAGHMDTAVQNGAWILRTADDISELENDDIHSQWLYQCGKAFTTVQEAIEFLENLQEKRDKVRRQSGGCQ